MNITPRPQLSTRGVKTDHVKTKKSHDAWFLSPTQNTNPTSLNPTQRSPTTDQKFARWLMVSRDRNSRAASSADVRAINARPATASAHVFAIA